MLRELRTRAIALVRRMDHTIGRRSGFVRVLVDVRTPMNLAVLRPVWGRLAQDPRVRLSFTAEDMCAVRDALAGDGRAGAMVTRQSAAWQRFDLALTADAWNHVRLHRCRRCLNFFHGVAGKYDLDDPGKLPGLALGRFDRVAFINASRMDRYIAAGAVRPDQAVLIGFPKLDSLVNGVWSAEQVRVSLGLDPHRDTVVYAPTFSTASSLHLAGEAIVEALLETSCNVIVKLHDRSMAPHLRFTGGIDWLARFARFEPHPQFALARGDDAGPVLAAADVLVTDHSTVGFEFALLDRPIVVYDAPDLKYAARIDPEKWDLLRSMADVAATPAALGSAVRSALADRGRLHEARRRSHTLFANPGTATPRAMSLVYQLLELSAPADLAPAAADKRHVLVTHTVAGVLYAVAGVL